MVENTDSGTIKKKVKKNRKGKSVYLEESLSNINTNVNLLEYSVKKKKKTKKEKESPTPEVRNQNDEVINCEVKKEKKKRKKEKVCNDKLMISTPVAAISEAESCDTKIRKKMKNKSSFDNNSTLESSEVMCIENVHKNKKSKKRKLQDIDCVENPDKEDFQDMMPDSVVKKKKKKKKQKELFSENEDKTELNEDIQIESDHDVKIKKKKDEKRKHAQLSNGQNHEKNDDIEKSKDILKSTESELPKKTIKKKKIDSKDECISEIGGEETQENCKRKKKKKKHEKQSEEEEDENKIKSNKKSKRKMCQLEQNIDFRNTETEVIKSNVKHEVIEKSKSDEKGVENVNERHQKADADLNIGQWATSSLGSEDRNSKFFRLLGGFKKGSDDKTGVAKGKSKLFGGLMDKTNNSTGSSKGGNYAMGANQEKKYVSDMANEYEKAMSLSLQRGVGLGFQPPPGAGKKFHIDTNSSKSVKFDD